MIRSGFRPRAGRFPEQMETFVKNIPSISIGSLIALPGCPKAVVIGVDSGREAGGGSAWFRVLPDGSAEPITVEAFMAVPILGTIGERDGQ